MNGKARARAGAGARTVTLVAALTVLWLGGASRAWAGNQQQLLTVPLASTQSSLVAVTNTATTANFALPQGVDVWFTAILSTTNNGTSNVWFTINTSADGLNYSTTSPIVFSAACGGSNQVSVTPIRYAMTNFTGLAKGQVTSVGTSQTNQVTVLLQMSYQVP